MKHYRVYGILHNKGEMPPGVNPDDFSRPGYKALSVWSSKRNDPLAIIYQGTKPPYGYRVVHGLSTLFFLSILEAEQYCRTHGFTKQQG